jgi:muconate cycloisomerase
LELGTLDAFGRSLGFSLSDIVAHHAPADLVKPKPFIYYSAVLSGSDLWKECLVAGAFLLGGFRHFKAKVGFGPAADVRKAIWLRRTIGGNDLRLDANGAWSPAQAGEALEGMSHLRLNCVEQPIAPGMEDALPALNHFGVPLMLDESVRTSVEAEHALAQGWCGLVNIRVSKCGGILASVRMLAKVKEADGRAQLGCMVGETGLLSAAGRHVACILDGFDYLEGSYDRYLHSVSVTEPDITFGSGGVAQPLHGRGLGVSVKPDVVERFTKREARLPW